MRKHSKARTPIAKISKQMRRTVGALRQQALRLGLQFCMKAGAGDGIPRGSFFSFSKTPLRAIVPRAVLALVNITQATKHPCAPVTVRGLIEMQRLGLSKPI